MSSDDLLIDELRLFEELCRIEGLRAGFRRVRKNKGSPGIDGVTIVEFESRLDEELSQLQQELESWTYQPSPVRRGKRHPLTRGADGTRPGGASHLEAAVRTDL